jgi:DNA-binding transcriptional ArsR family regulator
MDKLPHHCEAYKKALQANDIEGIHEAKTWLTSAAATAILKQDTAAVRALRARLTELAGVADHFDITGKPGDRWRTLADILYVAAENSPPAEPLRLVPPGKLSGSILKHIREQAGLTPNELAQRCQKNHSHISNELKKLESAGLIRKVRKGRNQHLFLSAPGREALDGRAPSAGDREPPTVNYPHADPERLNKLGENPRLPHLFQTVHG